MGTTYRSVWQVDGTKNPPDPGDSPDTLKTWSPLEGQDAYRAHESIARLLGQLFCAALFDELKLRGLDAQRIATETTVVHHEPAPGVMDPLIELGICAQILNATQAEFIDSVLAAKQKCLAENRFGVHVRIKAQLEACASGLQILN